MKVKTLLQSVIPSSSHTRRGGRHAIRRGNNEFHRLEPTHIPNVHFSRNFFRTSRDGTGTSHLIPEAELPIELENFQETSTSCVVSNEVGKGSNKNNLATGPSTSHDNNHLRFDDDFKVYNPTSEELPQENSEDTLQLALSDVRLRFGEMISGESSFGNDDLPDLYSHRRRPTGIRCCQCLCGWGKSYLYLIFATLFALLCAIAILVLLLHTDKIHTVTKTYTDLEILFNQEWPLHDIESRKMHVSFDPHKRDQLRNHLEKDLFGDDDDDKITDEHNTSLQDSHKLVPGVLMRNGHTVDQSITEKVFHSAKELLHTKINKNSTSLESFLWKGVATNFVLNELKLNLSMTHDADYLEGQLEDDICDKDAELECSNSTKASWFRSANGSCNNVGHKTRGSLFAPFRIIISAAKKNGQPSLSESFTDHLTGGHPEVDSEASALLPLWGLFISHDTVKTAKSPVPCHDDKNYHQLNTSANMGFCSLILSSNSNHHTTVNESLSQGNTKCSPASECPATYPSCKIGPRTSFNLVTSYIDASNIYGSSQETMDKLRVKDQGRMKVTRVAHSQDKEFLPLASELGETCQEGLNDQNHNHDCFISGDIDINQLSALTALNTLFLRQHNLIASSLKKLNFHWDDERLFQESRRILIAQIQHITYSEFLPRILGNQLMNSSGLSLHTYGFYDLYDADVDSSVSDVFAGAVKHFVYSMSDGRMQSIWKLGKRVKKIRYDIGVQIFQPEFLMKGRNHLEAVIGGLASLAVNRVGLDFSPKMRSVHLKNSNITLDLVRLALEEGRGLQIPPYVEWRKACGFPEIKSFQGLKRYWHDHAYLSITNMYKHVEEVDLFTGMLAEIHITSGRVGPTLACLLIDQFLRFKQGDRFWYEGDICFHHLSESQLKSIRDTTLARILCDTTDRNFDQIQKWSMLLPSISNPVISCSDMEKIPTPNLHPWKERPYKLSQNDDDDEDYDSDDLDFVPIDSNEVTSKRENESLKTQNHKESNGSPFRRLPAIELHSIESNHNNNSISQNNTGTNRFGTTPNIEKIKNYKNNSHMEISFNNANESYKHL